MFPCSLKLLEGPQYCTLVKKKIVKPEPYLSLSLPASRNALCALFVCSKLPPCDPSWKIILFLSSAASVWTSVCINIYEKDRIL